MSKSPSLRRIKADIRELSIDPSDQYHAAPLEHDMFEWHFTIRGADDTDFAGGVYHGRILLPPEYPFKPPNIVFLTPSGRFETGVKVCLSFSAHHPELWQPAWGIRLILEALISFLPTPADGAIGALDWTPEERKKLARESVKFRCNMCCAAGETCAHLLPERKAGGAGDGKAKPRTKFQEEIEKLKMLQFQNHAVEEEKAGGKTEDSTSVGEASKDEQEAQPNTNDAKPTSGSPPKPECKEEISHQKPEVNKAIQTQQGPIASQPNVSRAEPLVNNAPRVETNAVVPPPPPVTRLGAEAVAELPANVAPAAPPAALIEDRNADNVIISDNMLHGMIGFFAILAGYLLREALSLVEEMRGLGDDEY
ncbi:hypothetical protein ACHAWF_002291 [Thalassiosira exigua]